jgi:hypothetical protein
MRQNTCAACGFVTSASFKFHDYTLLDSAAVSEAHVPGAGDRIYDHGPASSPRSCWLAVVLDVGLVGGGGPKA